MNINETGHPGDPKPTMYSRNADLATFYYTLPRTILGDDKPRSGRTRLEDRAEVLTIARGLLVPSHLTSIGKEVFLHRLGILHDIGINGPGQEESIFNTLQIGNTSTGGIYNNAIAGKLECAFYQLEYAEFLEMGEVSIDTPDLTAEDIARLREENNEAKIQFVQWRKKIIETQKLNPEEFTEVPQAEG